MFDSQKILRENIEKNKIKNKKSEKKIIYV